MEEKVIFEDLDIWEATSEAIKLIVVTDKMKTDGKRKYYPPNPPSVSTVRKFLYGMGRKDTKGLTKAWESLVGLIRMGSC